MEIRQLNYFVKVAELLNFSEAAKVLCITQSTLSQQIKQLETELDARLFERNSHSVALTEEGNTLLPYAVATLRNARECRERINDIRQLLSGTLNIGSTYTFSPILTETLMSFMKAHPGVKLNIFYKPMNELLVMLQRREIDFALAFKPSQTFDDVESQMLFENRLTVVVNPAHPLADAKSITPEDLKRLSLALPARGMQARNATTRMLERCGMTDADLRIRIELNEVNILLKIIRQSQLATILAEASIHNEPGVVSIPLDYPENEMAGCLHTLRGAYRKHSAQEFIRMFNESEAIRSRIREWL